MARRIIAWVVATIGPVFVVAAGGRRGVTVDHPVAAGALLVVYEVAVAVFAFAGGVAGQLRDRWQERVANRLDVTLTQWLGGLDRRYRESVLASLRFIDVKGLATVGFYQPELDEVFVDVSLAYRAPNQLPDGLLAQLPPEVTDRHSIGDFLDDQKPRILAVVGVPGSGKTTLLRHTAREICRHRRRRRRTVPILLYLRDHAATIVADPDVRLPELSRDTLGAQRGDDLVGWLERRLRHGDCVVLLDGLDEVGQRDERGLVADWVDRQAQRYPANDYVITSRPHGYRTANIDGATVLQVRSFSTSQVSTFVRGWYLAIEEHTAYQTRTDLKVRAAAAAEDLLERLNHAPGLHDLTVNPLLLTMIANVHRYRGALPGSRVRLYEEICQVMLWRRQEAKRLPMELGGDEKEILLRGLAYAMMQRRVRDLPAAEVLAEIGPGLRRMSTTVTPSGFLADVVSNGLLIERESGVYSFAHLTFQEYLAAAHIRDRNLSRVLTRAVEDTWWRETTLLYVARSDADPIVRACLKSASLTALSLAVDCADQGSQLAPELRSRLDELLGLAFTPQADPERRRLVTGVLITRQLREVVQLGTGGRICAAPVTGDLYRIFQQDTGTPPPDAPAGDRPQPGPGTGRAAATGMWSSDAHAFARWVNGITGGEPGCRLPSREELDDPAGNRALMAATTRVPPTGSAWIEPADPRLPAELWTPPDADHPHAIEPVTITEQINTDVVRAKPTLTRLLLLRSIVAVRILTWGLDLLPVRDRARGLDQLRGLDLDLARDRLLDLTFDLSRTLVLGHADHPDQHVDNARALSHLRAVNHILTGAISQDRHDRAMALAGDLDRLLVDGLHAAMVGAGVVDRVLGVGLDQVADPYCRPVADLDSAFDAGIDSVMGSALANALAEVLRQPTHTVDWSVAFAQAFGNETNPARRRYVIAPETLAGKLEQGTTALAEILRVGDAAAARWAGQVAHGLREVGLPVFHRTQALTAHAAIGIRLGALCLAAEAESRGAGPLGETFRDIAAGTTLLERRVTGRTAAPEMILLALA